MSRFQHFVVAVLLMQVVAAQFTGWGEGSRESNSMKAGAKRSRNGERSWANSFGTPGINATYDYVVSTSLMYPHT
jgi:hypothetical protein